jgi:hypothetical protein
MAVLRIGSKCSHTNVYAPLFRRSASCHEPLIHIFEKGYRSGFKTSDQVQGQGVPRIGNGAYTQVHEYFNSRDNTAIGPQMGF